MKKLILRWDDQNEIKKIAAILEKNELIVGTTDTVIGFFALPTHEGFFALNRLKKRGNKPYLLLTNSHSEILKHIKCNNYFLIEKLMEKLWPGPLTIIFKAKKEVPAYMCSDDRTIAFRIPDHQGILSLCTLVPLLFSTSANETGMPVVQLLSELNDVMMKNCAAIVTDNRERKTVVPSTIIDCSKLDENKVVLVREGVLSRLQIQMYLPQDVVLL